MRRVDGITSGTLDEPTRTGAGALGVALVTLDEILEPYAPEETSTTSRLP